MGTMLATGATGCSFSVQGAATKLTVLLNRAGGVVRQSRQVSFMTVAARTCNHQTHTFLALALLTGLSEAPGNLKVTLDMLSAVLIFRF